MACNILSMGDTGSYPLKGTTDVETHCLQPTVAILIVNLREFLDSLQQFEFIQDLEFGKHACTMKTVIFYVLHVAFGNIPCLHLV